MTCDINEPCDLNVTQPSGCMCIDCPEGSVDYDGATTHSSGLFASEESLDFT